MDCINLISLFDSISFSWARRSANMVAHVVASKGLFDSSSWASRPPVWLEVFLDLDLCSFPG